MAEEVFVSHASDDAAIAQEVCRAIEARGMACWIAPRDVLPGQDYGGALSEALARCHAMVVVLSAQANKSVHVMREVERAASRGVPIVPLRIQDVTPVRGLEYFLSSVQWLDALSSDRHAAFERLADVLLELLGQGTATVDRQEKTFLLRWFPPPAGAAATLTIREDSRMTMRIGPASGPLEAQRQRIRSTRVYRLTAGPAKPASFLLELVPTSFSTTSEVDGTPFLSVTARRIHGRVQSNVESADPSVTAQFEEVGRAQLNANLTVELTHRGVILAVRGGSALSATDGAGEVARIVQGIQWVAGETDFGVFLVNSTFLTFPEEPVREKEIWQFQREMTSMGARVSGTAEAHIDGFDSSEAGDIVRVAETTAYQVDATALARGIAQGVEAAQPGLVVRPVSAKADCPPVQTQCVFDASAGHLVTQSSIMDLSFSARLAGQGPAGGGEWLTEQSLTYRSDVEWTPDAEP